MFWIRHPQPLLSTKAVAMQVVARKAEALRDTKVIVVDKPAADPQDPVSPAVVHED